LFDIPEVNPDAKLDGRHPRLRIPLVQMLVDVDRALDSSQGAFEFGQEPVAHRLDLTALVSGEKGTN
jgi:hypothetical protein